VWRARDRELDELVALKLIRPELARIGDMVARFRSEVKLARRVTHRHVARIYELGNADGVAFFTMELVEGRSLGARLRADGRLPWREAVGIAIAIADGLEAAHAVGVVHRDVKPDNVLLEDGGRVVLTDFGIAAARASAGDMIVGTPAYMAPEQAERAAHRRRRLLGRRGALRDAHGVPWPARRPDLHRRNAGALGRWCPIRARHRRRGPPRHRRDPAHRIRRRSCGLLRWATAWRRTAGARRSDAAVRDLVEMPRGRPRCHVADAVYEQLVAARRSCRAPAWSPAGRLRSAPRWPRWCTWSSTATSSPSAPSVTASR
jgi:hypothetical protein